MLETTTLRSSAWGSHNLAPAEGQQLAGQAGGAVTRFQDFTDILPFMGPGSLVKDLTVAQNDRQKVIKVVGHATRQLSNRLHLGGLANLFLELAPFGNIANN